MQISAFGVLVDAPARHNKVLGYEFGALLGERGQLFAYFWCEFESCDVRWNGRSDHLRLGSSLSPGRSVAATSPGCSTFGRRSTLPRGGFIGRYVTAALSPASAAQR
jgi:hypothetical protein